MTELEMLIHNINSEITALNAELLSVKERYSETIKNGLVSHILKLLSELEDAVEFVMWTQYTPYFNDGDECYFRVGELEVKLVGVSEQEVMDISIESLMKDKEYYTTGNGSKSVYAPQMLAHIAEYEQLYERIGSDKYAQLQYTISEIQKLVSMADEEIMKTAFGDHVSVTIYSNGNWCVEDYEHD